MELSYCDLQKREVVSVTDGKCFGKIVDMTFSFPRGVITGITVPAKKSIFNVFGFYEKLFIEDYKIKKIGTDVILVDLNAKKPEPKLKPCNPCDPCAPIFPQCPPKAPEKRDFGEPPDPSLFYE